MSSVKERFLRYVQVETTSCEANECCPSTPGQKVLGEMLVKEMQENITALTEIFKCSLRRKNMIHSSVMVMT